MNSNLFLLNNLPPNSSFGLDTKQWTVANFSGVKNIPSGLHLFTFSAAPTSSSSSNSNNNNNQDTSNNIITNGIGIRHGLFKFFNSNQSETLIEEWDNIAEELLSDKTTEILNFKRNRIFTSTSTSSSSSSTTVETIISPSHLKTLDKSLASYPEELKVPWNSLTNFITPRTLYRVIGIDSRGNFRTDATMGTNLDLKELKDAGQKIWGKARKSTTTNTSDEEKVNEIVKAEGEREEQYEGGILEVEEVLEFLKIDEKRSWPIGAIGEELTKWSKDKSWYLSSIILNQFGNQSGDIQEFLSEFQLSFTLFVLLHNFSSLTIYKSMFHLLTSSPSLLLPLHPIKNPINSQLIQKASLPLFKSFLNIFRLQLNYLENDFFALELPDLETSLLNDLNRFSTYLFEAAMLWDSISDINTEPEGEVENQSGSRIIFNLILSEWNLLLTLTREKFGWELNNISNQIKLAKRQLERALIRESEVDGEGRNGNGNGGSRKGKRDEDEIDLEDLEEGEDGPVIIEL